jgi:signal transduction histidine kinase
MDSTSRDLRGEDTPQLPPESLIERFFHKLSQPIGALSAALEMGLMSDDPKELRVAVENAMPQMERLLWLFEATRRFFGTDFGAGSLVVSLRECLEAAIKDMLPLAESAQIELLTRVSGDATVMVNPAHLRDAIENVLTRSIRESDAGSKVNIELAMTNNQCCIVIADETRCPPGVAESAFDPFPPGIDITRERPGNLDLALSQSIVRAFDGDLTLEPRANGMRQFVILLPLAEPNS